MPTVVDQFVVKYVLDTKDLDKGISATEKKLEKFKKETAEAGSSLGDSIEAGAKRANGSLGVLGSMLGKGGLIGVAIGSLIYAGKKVDDKLFSIAHGLRRLGIDSKNFGIAANEMRNFQNASEMAGGSLEDATQTVGDLQKSLFNLKFNGQVSDSLVMLSRLGVQFQDSYGRARDFNDVVLDTATALEKAQRAGRMTQAEAFQFASQAGFTGGMAQLVTGGRAGVERELSIQRARRQVQGGDVAGATRWERGSISLGQATLAEVGTPSAGKWGDIRGAGDEKLERAGKYAVNTLSDFGDAVSSATRKLKDWIMSPGKGVSASPNPSALNRGLRNNNPLNLMARRNRAGAYIDPHDDKGFRIFNSMDEGMEAANNQLGLYQSRGNKTLAGMISTWAPERDKNGNKINNTKEYIDFVSKGTGIGANQVVPLEKRAAMAAQMARFETGYNVSTGRADSGNVQISSITITTQATDAHGIARDIGGELAKRKMLAAHAEGGVQ